MDQDMGSASPSRRSPDFDAMETDSPSAKRFRSSEPEPRTNGIDHDMNGAEDSEAVNVTPTPKRRGRPPKSASRTSTPTSKARTNIFETPTKTNGNGMATPQKQAADRSAMRKSVRAMIEHAAGDGESESEGEDDLVARELYGGSDVDETELDTTMMSEATTADEAKTPTKRKRRARARSPTPPRDLPAHEMYFIHNKPGRPKTSDNTLASLGLLTHDEYFTVMKTHVDPHAADIEYLESIHAECFPQWTFELSEGYSLCVYGFGSKRSLLRKFATHLHKRRPDGKIVMINGYAPTTNVREMLSCVASAVDPAKKVSTAQPSSMVRTILATLEETPSTILTIVVNSIDGGPMRKGAAQAVLAELAAHPQVQMVCSADSPDFGLLWDVGQRTSFNFTFHDCTTFAPFLVELDAVDEVHELLGRKAHRVNGREGVAFVLKSLPENAKNLFQLLVGEVLIAMEEDVEATSDEGTAVEYRMVYNKAVEEFICSSEMAFRTLLKEYVVTLIPVAKEANQATDFTTIKSSRAEKTPWAQRCSACRSPRKSSRQFSRISWVSSLYKALRAATARYYIIIFYIQHYLAGVIGIPKAILKEMGSKYLVIL